MKVVGKLTDKGFRATPNVDVMPGTIFVPNANETFFGIADDYVKAGNVGNFSTRGVYTFTKPSWWDDEIGQLIYYKRDTATSGIITNSQISTVRTDPLEDNSAIIYGGIACVVSGSQFLIGYQVEGPQPNLIYVYLCNNNTTVSSYDAYITTHN